MFPKGVGSAEDWVHLKALRSAPFCCVLIGQSQIVRNLNVHENKSICYSFSCFMMLNTYEPNL